MRRILVPFALIPFLAVSACAGNAGEPCAGQFTYRNGSMPPPHSYEWTITFDALAGDIAWSSPNVTEAPVFSAEFEPTADRLVALCDALRGTEEDVEGVGGSAARWDTDAGSGSTTSEAEGLAQIAVDLVGDGIYGDLMTQYTEWAESVE